MGDAKKKEKEAKPNLDSSDPKSPYYLCSSDNPGNIVCPKSLNGQNYANRSRLAANGLKSKNKLGFVDGSPSRPDDASSDADAWEKNNAMVRAWLHNVIDKNLHGSIAYAETAREIWTDLKERYSQGNEIRIHQLRRTITLTSQGSLNVTDYFTKLKTLWDELSAYLMMPNCKCVKDYNLYKYQEAKRVHQFLMGLDSSQFGVVRSNILSIKPLPNLNKAYSMILCEERRQSMTRGMENKTTTEAAAFKASTATRARRGGTPKCTYCLKLGHEKSQCYELNGYPPNWQGKLTHPGHKLKPSPKPGNDGGGELA